MEIGSGAFRRETPPPPPAPPMAARKGYVTPPPHPCRNPPRACPRPPRRPPRVPGRCTLPPPPIRHGDPRRYLRRYLCSPPSEASISRRGALESARAKRLYSCTSVCVCSARRGCYPVTLYIYICNQNSVYSLSISFWTEIGSGAS